MNRAGNLGVIGSVGLGLVSGAAGTAAMDYLLYRRDRRQGSTDPFLKWEFADAVTGWDEASAPGQLGEKVERLLVRRTPPDSWARPTTNLVHWATGVGWGLQFGLLAGPRTQRRWALALALGPTAWLASYLILPLAHVYKPIWDYDAATLREDLSAHLLYGAATGATFIASSRILS